MALNEARVRELSTAIMVANPTIAYGDANERARSITAQEELHALQASLRAQTEDIEAAQEVDRETRRVAREDGTAESHFDLSARLKDLDEAGEGISTDAQRNRLDIAESNRAARAQAEMAAFKKAVAIGAVNDQGELP